MKVVDCSGHEYHLGDTVCWFSTAEKKMQMGVVQKIWLRRSLYTGLTPCVSVRSQTHHCMVPLYKPERHKIIVSTAQ